MSSCEKPIFVSIINESYTPGNQSPYIVRSWFSSIVGGVSGIVIDTLNITKEKFVATLMEVCKNHNRICLYLCIHGVQYRENEEVHEKLKINDKVEIPDYEFTAILNGLQYEELYIFNESCHGAGLFNSIVLDRNSIKIKNIILFNVCSKDQKCYVKIISTQSVGIVSHYLFTNRINPFKTPDIAYNAIKKYFPDLQTTVTLLKNLN